MDSVKEHRMNLVNATPLGMKAIQKRSLYKLKTDDTFKSRLVVQTFHQQTEAYPGSTLAAIPCARTEREVLTIIDEYDSSVAQMGVSLPKLCNRDKRFFS